MVTSPNERKILEWDEKPQTNIIISSEGTLTMCAFNSSLFTFSSYSPCRITGPISTKLGTKHKAFLVKGDSGLFKTRVSSIQTLFQLKIIVKIHWPHFKIFSRTTGLISTKASMCEEDFKFTHIEDLSFLKKETIIFFIKKRIHV